MLQWIKLEASFFFFFDIAEITREDEVTVLILAGMRV